MMFKLGKRVYAVLTVTHTKKNKKGSVRILNNIDEDDEPKYEAYEPNDLEMFRIEKKTIKALKLDTFTSFVVGLRCH